MVVEFALDKSLKKKYELMIKRVTDDDENDNCVIFEGDTGCLAGDTIIRYNRGNNCRKITIKKLFEHYHNIKPNKNKRIFDISIPTYIRAFNGKEIRLHKLKDVFYSGKKLIYMLILEDGKTIKATSNHKFLTSDYSWKELKDFNIGDIVLCDTPKPEKNNRRKIKLRDIGLKVDYHPYKNPLNKQVSVHTLIYEARMNNLDFIEYLDILLNEKEIANTLKYINPNTHIIHHKDNCHYNNSIDNLQLMTKEEHLKYHAIENNIYKNFSQGIPKQIKIKKIIELTYDDTYDIECEEPYHNFVANDIIVHNSGKTNASVGLAYLVSQATGRVFDNSRIFFDTSKAVDFAKSTREQIIIFDEPAFGGLKAEWRKKSQIDLIKLLYTARMKRHFLIFNIVKFSKFSDEIIEKAIALIRIYKRDETLKERRFLYIPKKNIQSLLSFYHKRHIRAYNKFKTLRGTLHRYILPEIIDKELYNQMKEDSIENIGNDVTKYKDTTKNQRIKWGVQRFLAHHKIPYKFLEPFIDCETKTVSQWGKYSFQLNDLELKKINNLPLKITE
jgi:hypothetical protein